MQEVGGNLRDLWFTAGQHDLVAVVEAPELRKALAFLVAFSSLSTARTTTLVAEPQIAEVMRDAHDAQTKIGGVGPG